MSFSDSYLYGSNVVGKSPKGNHELFPLSLAQQRLWFLSQLGGVSEAYHLSFALRLKGELDANALRRALDRIVYRHETLRTTFAFLEDAPVQQIEAADDSSFALLEHDLRQLPDVETELARLSALEAATSFDLQTGPLVRGRLVRIADDESALLITMHHIVSDGWSMGILVRELSTLYSAYLHGQEDPLPDLVIQYADYAAWQREWIQGDLLHQQTTYWKEALVGAPNLLELPTDYPRPMEQDHAGAFVRFSLDESLTEAIKKLSRKHGTTLFMTLLGAWAILLSRLSGQSDVVIGSPAANRRRTEIEGLIGFFVNTLALRLDLSGSPTVGQLLMQIRERTLAAQQYQDIPFEQIVELVQPTRSLAHSPLFQVMFAWQNNEQSRFEFPGIELKPLSITHDRVAKFDLTLSLQEAQHTLIGEIEYASALFKSTTIERYIGYFRNLLQAMASDDTQAIDRLPMLPASKRHQVLYGWNDTATDYPSDQCIHQLFEAQVAKAPDAVAVVFEQQQLTYNELNIRANQLAHHLRELGVRPEDRVAICVERGFEMITALLAVLKAGGAYVPLDPDYPSDRLHFMLQDSGPVVLLTQSHLKDIFTDIPHRLHVLQLDDSAAVWQTLPEGNLSLEETGLTPNHLAYVIYTSGSTGQPKGVMVQHQGLCNRLAAIRQSLNFSQQDGMANVSSFGFDISVWELWGAFLHGSRLIIIPHAAKRSPDDLYRLLSHNGVTILNQTPTFFRQLVNMPASFLRLPSLRYVILGGEALDLSDLRAWYERYPNHQSTVVNMYGITETTVHATLRIVKSVDLSTRRDFSIGRGLPDLRTYVLDSWGSPVPVGVTGELYIGGAGVARGYLNRPELTAERFLPDPFVTEVDARMYRTGDLGRWLPDGNLEFLGRNDFQVKIRGFRIELGEIEARLMEHPEVQDAVVVAREEEPGDKRLVAYYTVSDLGKSVSPEELRSHLSETLPDYMLPAAFVFLESMPLTPNGKLD